MKMNKKYLILASISLSLIIFLSYRYKIETSLPSKEPSIHKAESNLPIDSKYPESPAVKSENSEVSLESSIPSISQIRAEAEKDPHTTPPSILAFATSLAPRMQLALESENNARAFLDELRTCIFSPSSSTALTIRAICLSNAKVLSEKFQSLEHEVTSILDKADPNVLKLIE